MFLEVSQDFFIANEVQMESNSSKQMSYTSSGLFITYKERGKDVVSLESNIVSSQMKHCPTDRPQDNLLKV